MYGNMSDFTRDIDGLVDASTDAAIKGGPIYLGTFHGFDLFVRDWSLLLTHPEWRTRDSDALRVYLKNNGWYSIGGFGEMKVQYAEGQIQIHYMNVNRITQRREKLRDEFLELSRLLESYRTNYVRPDIRQ